MKMDSIQNPLDVLFIIGRSFTTAYSEVEELSRHVLRCLVEDIHSDISELSKAAMVQYDWPLSEDTLQFLEQYCSLVRSKIIDNEQRVCKGDMNYDTLNEKMDIILNTYIKLTADGGDVNPVVADAVASSDPYLKSSATKGALIGLIARDHIVSSLPRLECTNAPCEEHANDYSI